MVLISYHRSIVLSCVLEKIFTVSFMLVHIMYISNCMFLYFNFISILSVTLIYTSLFFVYITRYILIYMCAFIYPFA